VAKALPIHRQRLVRAGQACPRCAETGTEVESAVAVLDQAHPPLGIRPLEITEIEGTAFVAAPSESNRISIDARTIEDWLCGQTGSSRCWSVCGDNSCRTVELEGASFEEVPARLILKAALLAWAALLDDVPDGPIASSSGSDGSDRSPWRTPQ
jgi:hypothetical protein